MVKKTKAIPQQFHINPYLTAQVEKHPALVRTLIAIKAWSNQQGNFLPARRIPSYLSNAEQIAWAIAKARQWVDMERQLYEYANNGATALKPAQKSIYSDIARLLLPYFDDKVIVNSIVNAAVDEIERRPLPNLKKELIPADPAQLWESSPLESVE